MKGLPRALVPGLKVEIELTTITRGEIPRHNQNVRLMSDLKKYIGETIKYQTLADERPIKCVLLGVERFGQDDYLKVKIEEYPKNFIKHVNSYHIIFLQFEEHQEEIIVKDQAIKIMRKRK